MSADAVTAPIISPAPLSFAHSDFYYMKDRFFGQGSTYMNTTFLQPVYIPYPQRKSLFRTLSWLLQQSPELFSILERKVDAREQKDIEVAFQGSDVENACREFWKQLGSNSGSSATAGGNSGSLLRHRLQTIYQQWIQSSPYIMLQVQERRLLALVYQEIIPELDNWLPNSYADENSVPITELEVKNKYEDLRQKRQGLHHAWLELQLHHPLDLFASLFLPNNIRRDIRLFLLLLFFETVEHYNRIGAGSPPSLEPMTTLSMLLNQMQVIFPARLQVLLPQNALFCAIFKERTFPECAWHFSTLLCSDPEIREQTTLLRQQEKTNYLHYLELPQVISYPCECKEVNSCLVCKYACTWWST